MKIITIYSLIELKSKIEDALNQGFNQIQKALRRIVLSVNIFFRKYLVITYLHKKYVTNVEQNKTHLWHPQAILRLASTSKIVDVNYIHKHTYI